MTKKKKNLVEWQVSKNLISSVTKKSIFAYIFEYIVEVESGTPRRMICSLNCPYSDGTAARWPDDDLLTTTSETAVFGHISLK